MKYLDTVTKFALMAFLSYYTRVNLRRLNALLSIKGLI